MSSPKFSVNKNAMSSKKGLLSFLLLLFILVCILYDCTNNNSKQVPSQHLLDEFFITIGTTVSMSDIKNIAKDMGLYINSTNTGGGNITYRIAADKDVAKVYHPKKGSYVTVVFNTIRNDILTEITYFDEDRMVAGYWSPATGYLLADYNYPQIVYHNEDTDETYSRTPMNNAKEIVEYSFDKDPGENFLETLFSSITSETKKISLLAFVNTHGLNYNSRGVYNEQIISYCYEIGKASGERGSYITFSVDGNDLGGSITRMTYYYYPAEYKNGYSANFYSESYATEHSVPSGFVLRSGDDLIEYSSAEELLMQLHN